MNARVRFNHRQFRTMCQKNNVQHECTCLKPNPLATKIIVNISSIIANIVLSNKRQHAAQVRSLIANTVCYQKSQCVFYSKLQSRSQINEGLLFTYVLGNNIVIISDFPSRFYITSTFHDTGLANEQSAITTFLYHQHLGHTTIPSSNLNNLVALSLRTILIQMWKFTKPTCHYQKRHRVVLSQKKMA